MVAKWCGAELRRRTAVGLLMALVGASMLTCAFCDAPLRGKVAYGEDAAKHADVPTTPSNQTTGDENTEPGNQTEEKEADEPHDPPTIQATVGGEPGWHMVEGCAYANTPIELSVEFAGWHLDLSTSVVADVPLEALLAGEANRMWSDGVVSFASWTLQELEDGTVRCSGIVTLESGGFEDDELMHAADGQGLVQSKRLSDAGIQASRVAIDRTAPILELSGIASGTYVRDTVQLELSVRENELGSLAEADGDQVLATVQKDGETIQTIAVAYDGAEAKDEEHLYHIDLPVRQTHEDDGTYVVSARLKDLAGNESASLTSSFVIDTTSPELRVTWSGSAPGVDTSLGTVFNSHLVARVSLRDKSFRASDPNLVSELVKVDVNASLGGTDDAVKRTSWAYDERTESFVLEVSLVRDGAFSLDIQGTDQAGNVMVGVDDVYVDAQGRYQSKRMIVDQTKPTVRVAYASQMPAGVTYDGEDYFGVPVLLEVTVEDRNLDLAHTVITDSLGKLVSPSWTASKRSKTGMVTYRATLSYSEERTGTGCGRKHVVVQAVDVVGNELALKPMAFVVDQTAPTLQKASVSKEPAILGRVHAGDDPIMFFNELDGIRPTLSFVVCDEYALQDVWMEDPDGTYNMHMDRAYGKRRATLSVGLVDGAKDQGSGDAVFDRDVKLYVRDLAGNVRVWTLDRKGNIHAQRATTRRNLSIYGDDVFPVALIKDTTAPRISISGVVEREYYREDQTIHIDVEEENLAYLQRFEGMRMAAVVTWRAGNASGETSSQPIDAHAFRGAAPRYRYSRVLSTDGHYTVTAQLEDYAGNTSNIALLRDVTIDKTPPQIAVTWDNDDAHNGNYYRAGRTATISVTEHNFSPELVRLDTSGGVGTWNSQGDVHTLEVRFDGQDSATKQRLSLMVSDLAGNESASYEAPEFFIDTQAPSIEIVKRVSVDDAFVAGSDASPLQTGTAYAEACMPMVRVQDEANLDASSVEVTIEGMRDEGQGYELVAHDVALDANTIEFDWGNLGLDETQEGPVYHVNADDVYTIRAKASDLAGNQTEADPVVFSVNRFGSNFYCEPVEGPDGKEERLVVDRPLTASPKVVIHEVNVSGSARDVPLDASHVVTKEHAHATSELVRTEREESSGYTLVTSQNRSEQNPTEGWTEYCYTVSPGNFGKGSDSDLGDGGQGVYRVDVSSVDKAGNRNTTAQFWDRAQTDGSEPSEGSATVAFTLDEDGPLVEDVVVPIGLCLAREYQGSFRVVDEITQGERIEVLVDGTSVPIWPQGAHEPLGKDGRAEGQGVFLFLIPAQTAFVPRTVEIRVADYTDLPERAVAYKSGTFRLTDGVFECVLGGSMLVVALVVVKLAHGALAVRRKGRKHGRTD